MSSGLTTTPVKPSSRYKARTPAPIVAVKGSILGTCDPTAGRCTHLADGGG